MKTSICDFIDEYAKRQALRLHMPGHKGFGTHTEAYDITEIPGADSLYEAHGVIAESEENASLLFGARTFYSTEGSSLCIRAMLYLALRHAKQQGRGNYVLAGRNAHKTFLSAAIAREVSAEGWSVVYDTAGKLFADFEAVKFGGDRSDLTRKYLECDLLIIDDLGTEMATQFTQSVLYQVINTRLMEEKPVIVSTNLTTEAISHRYAGPIASRLLGSYQLCPFLGRDIRQLRR